MFPNKNNGQQNKFVLNCRQQSMCTTGLGNKTMNFSKLSLPSSLDAFCAPQKSTHGHSFSAKINLDTPFFTGFDYKQLRHMVLSLRSHISAYRVMAYLYKQGINIERYCDLELPPHQKEDLEWFDLVFQRWLQEMRTDKLLTLENEFMARMHNANGMVYIHTQPRIGVNIKRFHQAAMLICEAMAHFGFITLDNEFHYETKPEIHALQNQSPRPRLPRSKAWLQLQEIIKRAKAYNDTHPPIIIAGVFLFGSLSRDAETVDDIDISLLAIGNRPATGNSRLDYDTFVETCRDYVDKNGITMYRNNMLDGPENDIRRYIKKQFSRLQRVKVTTLSQSSLSDDQARFFCLFEHPDFTQNIRDEHNGVVDIERSVIEGRLILKEGDAHVLNTRTYPGRYPLTCDTPVLSRTPESG